MEQLLNVLNETKGGIDWQNEKELVTDGLLDSIDLVAIIPKLEGAFGIEIGMEYLDAENFENIEAMWDMIQEIKG